MTVLHVCDKYTMVVKCQKVASQLSVTFNALLYVFYKQTDGTDSWAKPKII